MMKKRSKGSGSMDYVGDDVMTEILSRLPTKSLRRFRCVSKGWNRLISNMSSRRSILLPVSGMIIQKSQQDFYVSLSTDSKSRVEEFQSLLRSLPFYSTFNLIHSSNGLFLFICKDERSPRLYYVWNPATMEYVALPKLPHRAPCQRVSFLAYDPCESPHYKVVRFTSDSKRTCTLVEIYSSLTENWTLIKAPSESPLSPACWYIMSVFHRGALYFLGMNRYEYLIRFDIETGSFHLTNLPEKREAYFKDSHDTNECIGESKGHLYYAVSSNRQFKLNIYMLKRLDPDKWQLTHTFRTNDDRFSMIMPIAFHPYLEVIYLSKQNKIISYHPCSRELKVVQMTDDRYFYLSWRRVHFITPCLESINSPGGKLNGRFYMEEKARGLEDSASAIESSSPKPQPDAVNTVFDHNVQVAVEALLGLVDPQPIVPATDERRAPEHTLLNTLSVSEIPEIGKSIEDTFNTSTTAGVIPPGTECSSASALLLTLSQGSNSLLSVSPAKLEALLSELKANALIPTLRPDQTQKSNDELIEEWADVCSQVLCITSYLAMAKAKVISEKLAVRLDNLKALKNSFDCSRLIRCFDRLLEYVQVIEINNVDIIESNLQKLYISTCRLHEDQKNKIDEKLKLVDAATSAVTNNIADLERERKCTCDRITDLRKRLAEDEAKLDNIHSSLDTEKQKEADLIGEKESIASEKEVLEIHGKELEDYHVKICAEAKVNLEKIEDMVKQAAISLSKFDLRCVTSPWEKE